MNVEDNLSKCHKAPAKVLGVVIIVTVMIAPHHPRIITLLTTFDNFLILSLNKQHLIQNAVTMVTSVA